MAGAAQGATLGKIIFDTDILIWYFRGEQKALRFIASVGYSDRAISSLTVMELVQGCRNREEQGALKNFLFGNIAQIVHPSESIAERAIALLERYAASKGLRVVDALIAATAISCSAVLATANIKHYRGIDGLELKPFRV